MDKGCYHMYVKKRRGLWHALGLLFFCLLALPASSAAGGLYPEAAFSADSILLMAQPTAPAPQAKVTVPQAKVTVPQAKVVGIQPAETVQQKAAVQEDRIRSFNTILHQQAVGGAQPQQYYLYLDKGQRLLTIYYADALGNSTGQVYNMVTVAIGKRTTPTPSGTFTLSTQERWHDFGASYAPYAIKYTDGRYLHGPLYAQRDESTIIQSRLGDFGKMATGGCVRMPYDIAEWIYLNCNEGTMLKIVNGDSQ